MGNRIPLEKAVRMARIAPCEDIYTTNNPYGFRINVNHPRIRPLYQRYKEHIGERILSDNQRRHFELLIFELMERRKIT
ncbi:MAG: hypothetical protein E7498_02630 [Ruminococcus sp.]|nr:hypothetical protein [Ruminococcus sp.]